MSMISNPAPSDMVVAAISALVAAVAAGGCSDAASGIRFEREELVKGEGFVDEAMERGPTTASGVAGGDVVARPSSRSSRLSSFPVDDMMVALEQGRK